MSDESIIVIDDGPDDCDVVFLTKVTKVEEECIFVEQVTPASTSSLSTSSASSTSSLPSTPPTSNNAATPSNQNKRQNTDHNEQKLKRKKKTNVEASHTLKATPDIPCISCCVCYEPYNPPLDTFYSTLCGHIYCSSCIEKIVKVNKACAVCRKKLTKKSYHRIFF